VTNSSRTSGSMRAIVQRRFGGPDVLEPADVPRPEPASNEVLVRVHAAGVNPIDCALRAGELGQPAAFPLINGRDISGVILDTGDSVVSLHVGDEVYGMLDDRAGGYAEYVSTPACYVVRKPSSLSHPQAAAMPLAGLTAWQMLVNVAQVRAGQRVLIHAAAGGVGHLAVQIAKARDAYVLATARVANHAFLHSLRVDETIDYTTTDFAAHCRDIDVVLNLVGGPYVRRSVMTLRRGGVLITVRSAGYEADLAEAEQRNVRVERFLVRPDQDGLSQLSELVDTGRLRVELNTVLAMDEASKAHALVESRRVRGKIVLETTREVQDG